MMSGHSEDWEIIDPNIESEDELEEYLEDMFSHYLDS